MSVRPAMQTHLSRNATPLTNSLLERAIEIAMDAHRGQLDKGGSPYILHPLRVMLAMKTNEERAVAVLHDVVEDGASKGWDFARIEREGFSAVVVEALRAVTKLPGEENDYSAFITRAMQNPTGRRVKLADLRDNSDVNRLGEITPLDLARLEKYRLAIERIERFESAL